MFCWATFKWVNVGKLRAHLCVSQREWYLAKRWPRKTSSGACPNFIQRHESKSWGAEASHSVRQHSFRSKPFSFQSKTLLVSEANFYPWVWVMLVMQALPLAFSASFSFCFGSNLSPRFPAIEIFFYLTFLFKSLLSFHFMFWNLYFSLRTATMRAARGPHLHASPNELRSHFPAPHLQPASQRRKKSCFPRCIYAREIFKEKLCPAKPAARRQTRAEAVPRPASETAIAFQGAKCPVDPPLALATSCLQRLTSWLSCSFYRNRRRFYL